MARRAAAVPARYRTDNGTDSEDDSDAYVGRTSEARGEKKKRRKANEIPQFVDQKRQTFSKRKKGMVSKAAQLSHLTGAKIFIFMANDNNHSWAYATHNFEVASAEETLRSMRLLAGISSASASTELMEHPKTVPSMQEQDDGPDDEQQDEEEQQDASARRPAAHTRVQTMKAEHHDHDHSSDTAAAAPSPNTPRSRAKAAARQRDSAASGRTRHTRKPRARSPAEGEAEEYEEQQEQDEQLPPESERSRKRRQQQEEDDMGEALQALQHMRSGAAAPAAGAGRSLPAHAPSHVIPTGPFPYPPPHLAGGAAPPHLAPPPGYEGHTFMPPHMPGAPYRPVAYPPFYGHPAYPYPTAWPAMPPMAFGQHPAAVPPAAVAAAAAAAAAAVGARPLVKTESGM